MTPLRPWILLLLLGSLALAGCGHKTPLSLPKAPTPVSAPTSSH